MYFLRLLMEITIASQMYQAVNLFCYILGEVQIPVQLLVDITLIMFDDDVFFIFI